MTARTDRSTSAALLTLVDDIIDRSASEFDPVWSQVVDLGLTRIGIDERVGGSGGTIADTVSVVRAIGRRGISLPVIESATANWLLAGDGERARPEQLAIVHLAAVAAPAGHLSVRLGGVPWARAASTLIVCSPDGPAYRVDLTDESVTIEPEENLAGEPRDHVLLDRTPVRAIVTPDHADVRSMLALLWAAALVGACEGAQALTATYVGQRRQFDAPLAHLPAVKRAIGLMRVQLVQGQAALERATRSEVAGLPNRRSAALTARVVAASVATDIAQLAHQLHGAMGVTWEYDLHPFTRRLWSWRDTVANEQAWTRELGRISARAGEATIWHQFTAAS